MTSVSARLCFCQAETANMEQFLLSVGLLHAMGHADCGASTGDVSRSWSGALGGLQISFQGWRKTVFALRWTSFWMRVN